MITLALLGFVGGLIGNPVTVSKTAKVVSDPVNGVTAPKAIPGAVIEYAITVTNTSGYVLDSGAVTVVDAIPAKTQLYVGDLGGGAGPILIGSVLSGLSTVYTSLSDTSDDVEFSNNGGASYSYIPSSTGGYDAFVTNIRIKTHGAALAGGAYTVKFRVGVK